MNAVSAWYLQPEFIATATGIFVAVAGGLLTEIGPWYRSLKMPKWKPPDWAFGPIWTVIFICTGYGGVLAWRAADNTEAKQWILITFAVNCVLNIAWSWLYFKRKRPDWALIEAVFLWLSIVAMTLAVYHVSTTAALLLLPYLIWVSIANVLNWETVRLNAPFA
jgi:translocator protein